MALKDLLESNINSRLTPTQQIYKNVQKVDKKNLTGLGNEIANILVDITRGIDSTTLASLKQRKARLEQAHEALSNSALEGDEYDRLSENIVELQAAMSEDISKKANVFRRMKDSIADNFIDASALLIGMSKNDPLMAFGIKYVGDKIAARRQRKRDAAAEKNEILNEDARGLISADGKPAKSQDDDYFGPMPTGSGSGNYGMGMGDSDGTVQILSSILASQNKLLETTTSIYRILLDGRAEGKADDLDAVESGLEGKDYGMPGDPKKGKKNKSLKGFVTGLMGKLFPSLATIGEIGFGTFLGTGVAGFAKKLGMGAVKSLPMAIIATALYSVYDVFKSWKDTGEFGNSGVEKMLHKIDDFFGLNIIENFGKGFQSILDTLSSGFTGMVNKLYSIAETIVDQMLSLSEKYLGGVGSDQLKSAKYGFMMKRAENTDVTTEAGVKTRAGIEKSALAYSGKSKEEMIEARNNIDTMAVARNKVNNAGTAPSPRTVRNSPGQKRVAATKARQARKQKRTAPMSSAIVPQTKGGKISSSDGKNVLLNSLDEAGIYDPTERAMFLAQMDHESMGFTRMFEMASGDAYEGKSSLGNNQPGDGRKFKGRGFVQLTGRWNYGHYGKMLGLDLANNPDLAADPVVAGQIAVAYWQDKVRKNVGDFSNVEQVTKSINGGYNGLADRQQKFAKYISNPSLSASPSSNNTGTQVASTTRATQMAMNMVGRSVSAPVIVNNSNVNNNMGGGNTQPIQMGHIPVSNGATLGRSIG